jgi:hypothetical protein
LKNQFEVIRRDQLRKALNFSYVISFVLLGGYMTALLPQAVFTVVLTWQVIQYFKIQNESKMSIKNAFVFLFIVSISYLVHPILAISSIISLLLHLTSKLNDDRALNRQQIYKIGLVSLTGVSLFVGLHIFWSGIAQENASIQVQRRKEQSFQTSNDSTVSSNNDSTVSSKKNDNPSESEKYVSDILEKQRVLKRNALVTDPLFTQSIIQPILENPVPIISNFPKLFFINMIGSPNSGPNVSIGFYRMYSGVRTCVVMPTAVVLSTSNGLLSNLKYRCKSPYQLSTSGVYDSIFKAVYLISWIIGIGLLLRLTQKMLFGELNRLRVCLIPLGFIGVYAALQASENRYGAPALPLLLMFGSGLSNSKNLKLRNKKRVLQ